MTRTRTRLALAAAGLAALVALTGCGPAAADAAAADAGAGAGGAADLELVSSVLEDPQPGDPAASKADTKAGGKADVRVGRQLLRKAVLHGEFVVKGRDGQVRTLVVQRGTVTAIGADSLGVRSSDGFTQTYALTEAVKVVAGGKKGDLGAVKVGVEVGVAADKAGDAVTARLVAVPRS